jgi:hypothetical protein
VAEVLCSQSESSLIFYELMIFRRRSSLLTTFGSTRVCNDTMMKKGFSYPSKCASLRIKESGGGTESNLSEHSIHECILCQLPYFETLLSESWDNQDQNNELSLELPPISNVEDFNTFIESLYQGVPLSPTTEVNLAVGVLALVKMLQYDGLTETALANIGGLTWQIVVAKVESYSTLE